MSSSQGTINALGQLVRNEMNMDSPVRKQGHKGSHVPIDEQNSDEEGEGNSGDDEEQKKKIKKSKLIINSYFDDQFRS